MNTNGTSWLKSLISTNKRFATSEKGNYDTQLYKEIQPSGLMYGHPIIPAEYKNSEFQEMDLSKKLKTVLLDGFIKTAFLPTGNDFPNNPDLFIKELSVSLTNYYSDLLKTKKVNTQTFWGRKKLPEEIIEELVNDRLSISNISSTNFWDSFFNNSLLFLDVFFYGEWLTHKSQEKGIDNIRQKRDEMHFTLLQVIAAAAYADNTLDDEEKALFNHFLKSANLPSNKKEKAINLIDNGISIDQIDLRNINSWILKKYLLELAILTLWADRVVTDAEKVFLNKLARIMSFSDEEVESSMAAIESFIIANWREVPFLQSKHNFSLISDQFVDRLSKVATKNKTRISQEIQESKELMALLTKSQKENLTKEEQIKVRKQLIDILKILPAFVIIALPGTFLTLPLLLKILPKNVFPSSFQE